MSGPWLIGCEESQAVCIAMRAIGIEAYSCDLKPCSGGHPEWHMQGDVFEAIESRQWYGMIGHPYCTYNCNSGVCHLVRDGVRINPDRWKDLEGALTFFRKMKAANIPHIALENPIIHGHAIHGFVNEAGIFVEGVGRPNQVVQPWMFGHPEQKGTCFWLKGLPPLVPTKNVWSEMMALPKRERERLHYTSPGPQRAEIRSKTFPGIAAAMAKQWGLYVPEPTLF